MDKWTKGSMMVYATSIASTWAWAPSLFLSTKQAYVNGWFGFLLFYLPNVLTLYIFGLFGYYLRSRQQDGESVTIEEMVKTAGPRQAKIHLAMTLVILFCSSCMQLMGIFMILNNFIDSKELAALMVFGIALWTMRDGIKSCIQTDLAKFWIIVVIGMYLMFQVDFSGFSLEKHTTQTFGDIWTSFGIPTVLGLMCAPYIDSTFIQRMYCVPKDKLVKTFGLSALLFALIPFGYGIVGFCGIENLATHFSTGFNSVLLFIAVLAALMATLDSNLCALGAIVNQYKPEWRTQIITVFYAIVSYLMISPPFDMTALFTLYCTIRCTMFVPTMLIATNHYSKDRLFYVSLFNCIVAVIGYLITGNFMFTLMGLFLPLLGYKKNEDSIQVRQC